jgi:hypothetical protein
VQVVLEFRASGFGMSCKWCLQVAFFSRHVAKVVFASGRASGRASDRSNLQVVVQVVSEWFASGFDAQVAPPHGLMHMAGDLGRPLRGAAPSSGRATERKAKKEKKKLNLYVQSIASKEKNKKC